MSIGTGIFYVGSTIENFSSTSNNDLYGHVYYGCDERYYVRWTNLPPNFDLQMTGDLNIWTNLMSVRDNKCMKSFSHLLLDTNHVGFYRLSIIP